MHSTGFHLHHGNCPERLADALASTLAAQPPDPLAVETILVPHPGMAQWLKMRLADRLGIAAHLEFPLPAAWLGRLAGHGQDSAHGRVWSGEALAWRLFALDGVDLGPLSAPALDQRGQLARWQLAGHLARLFERYQVQRADWVLRWLAGQRVAIPGTGDAERWQRRLWQHLLTSASSDEQQALRARLQPSLPPGVPLPPRLFAFGFASLPVLYQQRLLALSQRLPVHLYFANPCRHYWGDLLGEREQLRRGRLLAQRPDHDPEAEGHPLLAAFGTVGRDFLHQLYAGDLGFAGETELFERPGGASALAQLQRQVLELAPAALDWPASDRSIRMLAAPSRRRELEGLHDILLGLFADPQLDLQPHQVAVLVPRLSDYAPLIEAVFGSQPPERRIPWQLTDVSDADRHPLPNLLLRLLDLPVSRFGLGDVLDLLARPAFAAAFAIAGDELPRLAALLEQAGARWGLDGAFRAGLGAGSEDAFSFRFALERLLAGWALGPDPVDAEGEAGSGSGSAGGAAAADSGAGGNDAGAVPGLDDGIHYGPDSGSNSAADRPAPVPFAEIGAGDAELVGRFVACLDRLDYWRQRLAGERSLGDWSQQLADLIGDCLAESDSDDDNAALLRLVQALDGWLDTVASGAGITVPRRVLRAALSERLNGAAVSALPGEGVNLCAMVPLRGVPFRVIALLGLSEGEFPRREPDIGHDLCRLAPRRGDRSVVGEDRYLMLEALVCAREVLLLSHVDRDPESGLVRPPAPVLAELRDHLARAAFADQDDPGRALATRIEQVAPGPDDPRHFGADARFVPSHAGDWLAPAPVRPPAVALDPALPATWRAFADLFTDPVRTQLRWRDVDLGVDDPPVVDSEPFELDGLSAWTVRDRALRALQRDPGTAAAPLRDLLQGAALLPAGRAGARAFAAVWDQARGAHARWQGARNARTPAPVEFALQPVPDDPIRLAVRIADADDHGVLRLSAGRLDGKRRLAAWLDLLALAHWRGSGAGLTAVLVGLDGTLCLHAPDDPGPALADLVAIWRQSRGQPLPMYRRASATFAEARVAGRDREVALAKAAAVWQGGDDVARQRAGAARPECLDPAAGELARCFARWCEDPFEALALAVHEPVLRAAESP
jgi:exodeoxyribonuclease V gamma subunit